MLPLTRALILFLALLSAIPSDAQVSAEVRSLLTHVERVEQAKQFLESADGMKGDLFDLISSRDTSDMDREILKSEKGNVIEWTSEDKSAHYFLKTLETGTVTSFRVQYIFLDNKRLTLHQIDSLRSVIIQRLKKGDSFETLALAYSMDGNGQRGGDLGWFEEGTMVEAFEKKVRSEKLGAVYTVDIPSEKWYYIVKNSHEPRQDKKVTVLYVEVTER